MASEKSDIAQSRSSSVLECHLAVMKVVSQGFHDQTDHRVGNGIHKKHRVHADREVEIEAGECNRASHTSESKRNRLGLDGNRST